MKAKPKIKILVIEDNRLLRDGITLMINKEPGLKVICSISDREKSLDKIYSLKPDIVLLDLGLRTQNSLEIVQTIKQKSPDIKVIVMDLLPIQSDILDFVKAGASGFILKDAMVSDFLKTIRLVSEGEKVLPPHMTETLFTQIIDHAISGPKNVDLKSSIQMTKRERQVIEHIAEGLTNKEIGFILHLSPYTVKSHVHNILEKMALHTRIQIAKYAFSIKETKTKSESNHDSNHDSNSDSEED